MSDADFIGAGPPPGYVQPPPPPALPGKRAEHAARCRRAIEQAHRDADRGKGNRHVWVIATSSYSVDIDRSTEAGRRAAAQLAEGDIASAIEGLHPVHTEVGFRLDSDGGHFTLPPDEAEAWRRERER